MNPHKTLLRKVGKAIGDFGMIRAGDRIAVGVSGGKDSLALACALKALSRRSPVEFSLHAFTVEQGKFVSPVDHLGDVLGRRGIPWTYYVDDASLRLLDDQPDHGCDICSRFRRRAVYEVASRLGCNVVALGHTADDLCEALLRNSLFTGRLSALPAVTQSRSGDFRLIRPLVYVTEKLTARYTDDAGLPITPCVCSHRTGTVRERLRTFLADLQSDNPHVLENLLAAMGRIDTQRLLDRRFLEPTNPQPSPSESVPMLYPIDSIASMPDRDPGPVGVPPTSSAG